MGRKEGGGGSCAPFARGELGPRLTQCGLGRGLLPYKWRLHPFSRLATIDMGQKLGGGGCALFSGGAGSPWTQSRRAEAYLHTKWHLSPSSRVATTDISRKLGALCPLGEGELSPNLTQCRVRRPRPTSVPSGILIHAAVWPQ